jgi:hypothetical protein
MPRHENAQIAPPSDTMINHGRDQQRLEEGKMTKLLSFAVSILAGLPLLGLDQGSESPAPISGPPVAIADMVAGSAAVRPSSITAGFGPDSEVLLPVVINTPGLLGTFFKTDGFFANYRDSNQEVLVRFIPQGVSAAAPLRLPINALTNVAAVDLLGSEGLSRTGVGALLLTGVLPGTDTVDTSAKLHALFRIWTPQPGSAGTTSFGAWGPPSDNIHGFNGAIALGLRQNTAFRTNVGVVNLDPVNTRTWTVTIRSGGTPTILTITLPPLSMQLAAVPTTITPTENGYLSVTYVPSATPATDFRWSAFGVTADNVTGDSWLSLATQSALLPVIRSDD